MTTWKDKIFQHLSEYKETELGIHENGIWVGNKKKYPHILPYKYTSSNLIEGKYHYSSLKWSINSEKSLHPGFHHLNSSQALAINLFVPFIEEDILQSLLQRIGIDDEGVCGKFEHVENREEGTNFDFFIEGKKHKYFFEVKYSEDRYGYATNNENHRNKFQDIYQPKLRTIHNIQREEFFRKYQLWRNISYANEGYIIFVFPRFRKDLTKITNEAIGKIQTPDKVKILYIDDIVSVFKDAYIGSQDHFREFENKYLNIKAI